MSLVDKIKDLCKEKDTNMAVLERELGFGKGLIRTWDTSSPAGDKLKKVALYFHVSVDYLLDANCLDNSQAKTSIELKFLEYARKIESLPVEQRDSIMKHFEDTINIYSKANNG